ncbi:MAG: hypothetical protein HY554_00930, partial [Elusimicrobia bacterium]|nr:hypothetical protein [Elusimicrobiota bacterium]
MPPITRSARPFSRTLASLLAVALAASPLAGPAPALASAAAEAGARAPAVRLPAAAVAGSFSPFHPSAGLSAPAGRLDAAVLGPPIPLLLEPAAGLAPSGAGLAPVSEAVSAELAAPAAPVAGAEVRASGPAALAARSAAGAFEPAASASHNHQRASAVFDESPQRAASPASAAPAPALPSAPAGRLGRVAGGFRAGLAAFKRSVSPDRERPGIDAFGGPKAEPMTFRQRLAYGLKWGVNLTGIYTLLTFALGKLEALVPWPLFVSDSMLRAVGRLELLANFGSARIEQVLANSPWSFLTQTLPAAVAVEELTFRGLLFGAPFMLLGGLKLAAPWLAKTLGVAPDFLGLRSGAQWLIGTAGRVLGGSAFAAAALFSSWKFASAHWPAWGIDPVFTILHLALGLGLAHVAYVASGIGSAPVESGRRKWWILALVGGLAAPFLAHLTIEALGQAGGVLALY